MKMISKVGLLLAASILMLHSLLPHEHHDEISAERHSYEQKGADSLLDHLLLAFHANLGENHLEEYEKSSAIVALVFIAVEEINYEFTSQWVIVKEEEYCQTESLSNHLLLTNQYRFRGPPQLI